MRFDSGEFTSESSDPSRTRFLLLEISMSEEVRWKLKKGVVRQREREKQEGYIVEEMGENIEGEKGGRISIRYRERK